MWSGGGAQRKPLKVIASTLLQRRQLAPSHSQVHHTVIAERNERQVRWHLGWIVVTAGEQRRFLEVHVRHVTCRTTSAAVQPSQSLLGVHW